VHIYHNLLQVDVLFTLYVVPKKKFVLKLCMVEIIEFYHDVDPLMNPTLSAIQLQKVYPLY
jgi:hypothetical protein